MTRIVLVTPEQALINLAGEIATANKMYESLMYYVNKTSLPEMMEDETGKEIIKQLDSATMSVNLYAGILRSYSKGDAQLGTEKEWMSYVDTIIDKDKKYTQSDLDNAIIQSAAASARTVMQAYDNNMKYLPEAVKEPIVDEAIVAAQKNNESIFSCLIDSQPDEE